MYIERWGLEWECEGEREKEREGERDYSPQPAKHKHGDELKLNTPQQTSSTTGTCCCFLAPSALPKEIAANKHGIHPSLAENYAQPPRNLSAVGICNGSDHQGHRTAVVHLHSTPELNLSQNVCAVLAPRSDPTQAFPFSLTKIYRRNEQLRVGTETRASVRVKQPFNATCRGLRHEIFIRGWY